MCSSPNRALVFTLFDCPCRVNYYLTLILMNSHFCLHVLGSLHRSTTKETRYWNWKSLVWKRYGGKLPIRSELVAKQIKTAVLQAVAEMLVPINHVFFWVPFAIPREWCPLEDHAQIVVISGGDRSTNGIRETWQGQEFAHQRTQKNPQWRQLKVM